MQDLTIIGAGPAGLSAAINASSEGLKVTLIEKDEVGGQSRTSFAIENYPGFPSGLPGWELARRTAKQAQKFGTQLMEHTEVVGVDNLGDRFMVHTGDGGQVETKTLMIATGLKYRRLEAQDVEKFEGRGIFYSATMARVKVLNRENVIVIGGGNSAGQAALHLAKVAKSVKIMIHRGHIWDTMSQYLVDRINKTKNIEVHNDCAVVGCHGENGLKAVDVQTPDGVVTEDCDKVFCFIGAQPSAKWSQGLAFFDEHGFVTDTVPGVFVAGDVKSQSTKRIACAVGDGAAVVPMVHKFLANPTWHDQEDWKFGIQVTT